MKLERRRFFLFFEPRGAKRDERPLCSLLSSPKLSSLSFSLPPPLDNKKPTKKLLKQDGTLVVEGASWRRERSLGPAKPGDFVFFRRDAPEALRACAERGEHVAVFSNQGTIRGALDGKNAWKQTTRMDLVQRALGGLPMTVVLATASKVCFFEFFFLSFSFSLSLIESLSRAFVFSLSSLFLFHNIQKQKQAENDPHRKPGRGMWDLFVSKLAPSG